MGSTPISVFEPPDFEWHPALGALLQRRVECPQYFADIVLGEFDRDPLDRRHYGHVIHVDAAAVCSLRDRSATVDDSARDRVSGSRGDCSGGVRSVCQQHEVVEPPYDRSHRDCLWGIDSLGCFAECVLRRLCRRGHHDLGHFFAIQSRRGIRSLPDARSADDVVFAPESLAPRR